MIRSEKDQGISDAFNKGLHLSSGEIVGFLNSDDEFYCNNSLKKIVEQFNNSKVNFVHGNMMFKDQSYGSNNRSPLVLKDNSVEHGMPFNFPTMYFRSSYLKSLPKFKNELRYAMDLDLVCSMFKRDQFSNSVYLGKEPLILMNAGGVSDAYEMKAHNEAISIIKSHNLWSPKAAKSFRQRKLRLTFKRVLKHSQLSFLIKIWRRFKWRS